MRIPRVHAVVIFLLAASTILPAQIRLNHQLNITGAGARAAAMGGAFIGVADDATAIVWNPAGLTQLERMEVSAVGRYLFEDVEQSFNNQPSDNESETQIHPVFNFGSFAIPFSMGKQIKAVFAAAYQRQLDFYYNNADTASEAKETGGADTFSPGLALGIGSIFSVGLAANIWFGSDTYEITSLPARDEKWTYDGTVKGVNFLVGALVDLSGLRKPIPIKIGMCVRTPFDLNSDYSYNFTPPLFGQYPTLEASVTREMPLMIGIGTSARPWENLTLSLDYETRKYGDKQTNYSIKSPALTDTENISASNSDINQFRAGIEYLIVTRGGVFPLRAGYQNVPTLQANYTFNGQTQEYEPGDQVMGTGFSVGTGFISNSIALDLTYSRVRYEQTYSANGATTATSQYTEQAITGSLIVYF